MNLLEDYPYVEVAQRITALDKKVKVEDNLKKKKRRKWKQMREWEERDDQSKTYQNKDPAEKVTVKSSTHKPIDKRTHSPEQLEWQNERLLIINKTMPGNNKGKTTITTKKLHNRRSFLVIKINPLKKKKKEVASF